MQAVQSKGVVCGSAPLGPRVIAVRATDDYELLLTFTGGEQRVFDARPLLEWDVFQPLKNKGFFSLVRVECGTVAWPGDLDYCPDTLYLQSSPR